MIECLSPVLDLYISTLDLIHLKDPYKSTLFFVTLSLLILHLEAVLSLALLAILLAIQYNAYYRREYQPYDVKYVRNAQFLLQLMNLIIESISITEGFVRDVIYWGNPAQSILMMNVALFGSIGLYLSLILLPLRQLTVVGLILAALRNSEFFNTLGCTLVDRARKIDTKQHLQAMQARLELTRARITDLTQKAIHYSLKFYEWPLQPLIQIVVTLLKNLLWLVQRLMNYYNRKV